MNTPKFKPHSRRHQAARKLIAEWLARGLVPEVEHTSTERNGIIVPFGRLWLRVGAPEAALPGSVTMLSSRDWALVANCKAEIIALLQSGGAVATQSALSAPSSQPAVAATLRRRFPKLSQSASAGGAT